GQLVGEHDVGGLRLAVGRLPGVVARALQVVERDMALRLYVGGDGYHPCGCAGLEPIEKEVGEQEGGEVVESKCVLQAIGRRVSVGPEPADVVDQHVEPRVGIQDGGG